MKLTRRNLMKTMGFFSLTIPFSTLFEGVQGFDALQLVEKYANTPDNQSEFWFWVKQSFTTSPTILNLNNGGVSPQPKSVQDAFIRYNQISNEGPAYFMWRILDQGREPLRKKLAELAGCSPDEIAINRNTTEGMDTIIFGLKLKPGDEVVLAKQDYPNVINAWKYREARDQIKLVWVDLQLPSENLDYLVNAYTSKFTSKTKVVNLTHMINWNGQILPVKEIATEAKRKGIYVLVDGAHTFAHLNFKIPDLNCDFFATSLHKWLCAPFGTGMLYIRKELISEISPLFPNDNPSSTDIRKFESLGTRSFPAEMAIADAINFHNLIGSTRKETRLRALKNYWVENLSKFSQIEILTPMSDKFSCGLGIFAVKNKKPEEVADYLFNKHKIYTVAINWENIHGVRVTPHLYINEDDLDRFVSAVKDFINNNK
ncbi:aminotransferase class V-fold PLP-dependent enzyme [Bacteroidetes/Chlorobi group bacterium Naka2016]|jgi:selenocysteine lyase/cysteine desulfurase|nr:MAG: aminotransferase class V-fold PLP-dependent enzyme [Bacteroidetes/Chlorobi group bacterium Naka2016]